MRSAKLAHNTVVEQICEVRDTLRDAYQTAVSLWLSVGGADPNAMHLPEAVAAKKDVDLIAAKLVEHRSKHGC